MKYIRECGIIFGITLVGEWLNAALPLPVPAGVYGLFLLLILLCTGILKLEDVEATGNFMLDIMAILFVPAFVGVVESYGEIRPLLVPLAVICVVSTAFVMAVTGKVAELMLHLHGGEKTPETEKSPGAEKSPEKKRNPGAGRSPETEGNLKGGEE